MDMFDGPGFTRTRRATDDLLKARAKKREASVKRTQRRAAERLRMELLVESSRLKNTARRIWRWRRREKERMKRIVACYLIQRVWRKWRAGKDVRVVRRGDKKRERDATLVSRSAPPKAQKGGDENGDVVMAGSGSPPFSNTPRAPPPKLPKPGPPEQVPRRSGRKKGHPLGKWSAWRRHPKQQVPLTVVSVSIPSVTH